MTSRQNAGLWGEAEAYERYMGRWSREVAPLFIRWLGAGHGRRWLDVGCGTGELSLCVREACRPSRLSGIDASDRFLEVARTRLPGADLYEADAAAIGLPDGEFDYVVSGLMLNFVPDAQAALREMRRVTAPGGVVALYVWDYAGHMQVMRSFFDAATSIDPRAAEYDDGVRAPICRPGPLGAALERAGLVDVSVTALDVPAAFTDFDDYWSPFLGGTGSAPRYLAMQSPARVEEIRLATKASLPIGPDGEILLAVRAWAAKGTVPPAGT